MILSLYAVILHNPTDIHPTAMYPFAFTQQESVFSGGPGFSVTFLRFSLPKRESLFQYTTGAFQNNLFFTSSCLWQEVFRSLQVQVCGGQQGLSSRGYILTATPEDQSLKHLAEVGSQGLNLQLLKSTRLKDHALTEMLGLRKKCQVQCRYSQSHEGPSK